MDIGGATVGADGTIFVADHSADFVRGGCYAFNPDGTRRWSRALSASYSAPALTSNGLVIVTTLRSADSLSATGAIHALNISTGATVWTFAASFPIYNSPVVAPDGTIYAASDKVYALTPAGAAKWNANMLSFQLLAPVTLSPDLSRIIAPAYADNRTYAFNASTGAPLWTFVGTGQNYASAAVFTPDSSRFVIGTNDKWVRCHNASTGVVLWQYATGGPVIGTASFDSSGNIYSTSADGFLYALSPDGSLLWRFFSGSALYSSVLLLPDATTGTPTLYVGHTNGYVTALSLSGAVLWQSFINVGMTTTPSMGGNGVMYIAANAGSVGVLLALGPCPAGFFCPASVAPLTPQLPQLCPAGHYCPTGSSAWSDKNCGRGNYCPWGSAAPISCGPKGAVNASRGPANGPAFMVEVAACLNHCYNGGVGQLSTCA